MLDSSLYKPKIQVSDQNRVDIRSPGRLILSKTFFIHGLRTLCLMLSDTIALVAARYASENLSAIMWNPAWSFQQNPSIIILIIGIHLGLFWNHGLYRSGYNRRNYPTIFAAVSLASLIILLIAFLYFPNALVARSTFLLFWALSFFLVSLGRYLANLLIIKLHRSGVCLYPVFVIADSQYLKTIRDLINNCPHYKFSGWDDMQSLTPERIDETLQRLHLLGVSEVYIHVSSLQDPMHTYWRLRHAGISLYLLPEDLNPLFRDVELSYVHSIPCFKLNAPGITGFNFWLKRSLDFFCAVIFIVLFSPLYLLLAGLIFLDNPGPIFYRQVRVGLHGTPFKVWKFRTMVTNADQLQKALEAQNVTQDGILFKMKDDPRITRLGKFLRRYSLDELPQIFNILFGEMSFIGPRPLPLRDVEKFSEHHHVRHEVLPGITGMWQVSGRSDILNFDDVLRLDIQYIERWSIWLDLKILLKTIAVVLAKSGAY
ncbi:MAG: sugar transferase [Synechococcales bacterium]|nr:sugar transferase [Synechococcales bacterium]